MIVQQNEPAEVVPEDGDGGDGDVFGQQPSYQSGVHKGPGDCRSIPVARVLGN